MDIKFYGQAWRICVGNGAELPKDLIRHIGKDGTKTWYSMEQGSIGGGDYLRRYGNGKYAIGLGTWYTNAFIDKAISEANPENHGFVSFLIHTKDELDRRVFLLGNQEEQDRIAECISVV